MSKTYNLAEFVERHRAEHGIPIELPDGTTVVIPPAELWPDEVQPLLDADDFAGATRLILGPDPYDQFVAAGGTWKLINLIMRDAKGASAGESSASSES